MKPEWKDAPKWANVLIEGESEEPSRYSWAEAFEEGAVRQYCRGARLVARIEQVKSYKFVGRRPDNG
jgi:hypothetical protein